MGPNCLYVFLGIHMGHPQWGWPTVSLRKKSDTWSHIWLSWNYYLTTPLLTILNRKNSTASDGPQSRAFKAPAHLCKHNPAPSLWLHKAPCCFPKHYIILFCFPPLCYHTLSSLNLEPTSSPSLFNNLATEMCFSMKSFKNSHMELPPLSFMFPLYFTVLFIHCIITYIMWWIPCMSLVLVGCGCLQGKGCVYCHIISSIYTKPGNDQSWVNTHCACILWIWKIFEIEWENLWE